MVLFSRIAGSGQSLRPRELTWTAAQEACWNESLRRSHVTFRRRGRSTVDRGTALVWKTALTCIIDPPVAPAPDCHDQSHFEFGEW
jgi:hypothetical protein